MMPFTIALMQLAPLGTAHENYKKSIAYCKEAKKKGAHLVLMPEVWQLGYDPKYLNPSYAIKIDDPFIQAYRHLAQSLQIAIAVTYLYDSNGEAQNQLTLFSDKGEPILNYAKVHTCDFVGGTERSISAGRDFQVASLPFLEGEVKLGAMICMDREFPESARTLSLKGAEIVIVPNACPIKSCPHLGDARLAGIRAMSYENLIGVAMTNYPAPLHDGHSCAFDNLGKPLVMANKKEGVWFAQFDLEALRDVREKEWVCRGAPARKPDAYY